MGRDREIVDEYAKMQDLVDRFHRRQKRVVEGEWYLLELSEDIPRIEQLIYEDNVLIVARSYEIVSSITNLSKITPVTIFRKD